MIGHRLGTTGILGERRHRKFEMGRQPADQGVDGFVHIRGSTPRMTQQRELYGKAEPVGGATAVADKPWSDRVKV
jgi:hypothetical protein